MGFLSVVSKKMRSKGENFRLFLRAFVLKLYSFCLIRQILTIGVIFSYLFAFRVVMYKNFGDAKTVFGCC